MVAEDAESEEDIARERSANMASMEAVVEVKMEGASGEVDSRFMRWSMARLRGALG